jgi:hypothetical protein
MATPKLVESGQDMVKNTNASILYAVTQGPTSALYKSKYNTFNLKYPRDLDSSSKGHSVRFDIYESLPMDLSAGKEFLNQGLNLPTLPTSGEEVAETFTKVWDAAEQAANAAADYAKKISTSDDPAGTLGTDASKTLGSIVGKVKKNVSKTAVGAITLYMPETLEFNYAAQYNNLSLATAAESVSGIASAITSVLNRGAVKLGLNYAGYVFNPQEQVLFEGIDFRTYNMSFTFTPYSQQEADEVRNIIKNFRKYAAPELITKSAGFFMTPPAVFQISFLNQGQENTNINKLKKSVLQNIDVNYAPNGWSAHDDGAPVQTTLTLQFKEIELVDKAAIDSGY